MSRTNWSKRTHEVPELGDPGWHAYSNCVVAGPLVFLAGQCGIGSDYQVVSTEFAPQARQVLTRVQQAVEAAGGSLDDIVTMTVFVTDIRNGEEFTQIRKEVFGRDFPASALIGVSQLMPPQALVEVQAIAVLPDRLESHGAA